MKTTFAEMLTKARKDAGFDTAYKFYYGQGGRKVLGMTYRMYMLMEQGRSLPAVNKLPPILTALGIQPNTRDIAKLAKAWLRTLTGERLFEPLFGALLPESPPEEGGHLRKVLRKTLKRGSYRMSEAQFRAMTGSFESYLCALALLHDSGSWTPASLAEPLKIKPEQAETAMKALARTRLLKEVRKGVYKCPLAGSLIDTPDGRAIRELYDKAAAYNETLLNSGEHEYLSTTIVRADAADFAEFLQLLRTDLSSSQAYSATEKTRNSAMFSLKMQVTRLRGF